MLVDADRRLSVFSTIASAGEYNRSHDAGRAPSHHGQERTAGSGPHAQPAQVDQRALEQFSRQEPQFKQYYETHYADSGYAYNQYRPAYQYAYELATDQRYRKMDWSTLELQARRGWNDGTMGLWDRYKDAVRFGWELGVIDERG